MKKHGLVTATELFLGGPGAYSSKQRKNKMQAAIKTCCHANDRQ